MSAGSQTRAARRHQTEQRILQTARRLFSERGLANTTVRAIAADAQVDPALVIHYFGPKESLFAKAISVTADEPLSDDPEQAIEQLLQRLHSKVGGLPETTLAMMRSMLTNPKTSEIARDLLGQQVAAVAGTVTSPDDDLRAALVMSTIMGVTIARELLGLDALARASPEAIVDRLRPCLQALLIADAGDSARRTAG
jgi:AcrR family transcriptional regulator